MRLLLAPILLLVATPALADQRIEMIDYSANRVYTVVGQRSIQTTIEFGEDEQIENIALGDASAWQVTPNKRANLIFVKPLFASSRTNMTVVTNRRRYMFDLVNSGRFSRRVYLMRFIYPEDMAAAELLEKSAVAALAAADVPQGDTTPVEVAPPPPPVLLNTNWKFAGDRGLRPASLYDDGSATYIAWSQSTELPGVFVTGNDGMEGAVNFTVRGDYLVIDGVAPRYILRMGKAHATVTNLAPRAPVPVAAAAPASASAISEVAP